MCSIFVCVCVRMYLEMCMYICMFVCIYIEKGIINHALVKFQRPCVETATYSAPNLGVDMNTTGAKRCMHCALKTECIIPRSRAWVMCFQKQSASSHDHEQAIGVRQQTLRTFAAISQPTSQRAVMFIQNSSVCLCLSVVCLCLSVHICVQHGC
jgi:hypothetical protein